MRHAITIRWDDGRPLTTAWLTTDHAASNYGLPVVVLEDEARGPAELAGELLIDDAMVAGRAEAAGYRVASRA